MKTDAIPGTLAEWNALIVKLEPRYRRLLRMASTRGGLTHVLRRRFEARLRELRPAARDAWLKKQTSQLLRMGLADRLGALFFRKNNRGRKAGTIYLIDDAGEPIRDIATPFTPRIVLKGVPPETTLPITLPLPTIQRHVRDFVLLQRRLTNIAVLRGRKRGSPSHQLGPALCLFLAHLDDSRRVPKAELLRLVNRETTADAYRWLDRRLTRGRQLLAVENDLTRRLKALSTDNARWFLERLLPEARRSIVSD